jgi:outer membrane protein TolC
MLNAQSEYNQKSAELVRLLNLDSKVKLISIDNVMLPLEFQQELLLVSDITYKNRPEIKSIDHTILSLQTERKITTTGLFIPTLSIGTYGSYFGRINGAVSPMFPSQYPETKQLYPTGMLNASLTWNIPLGRLVYGGDLKQYNSQIKIQEIKSDQFNAQINEEITNANQLLIIGKEQIQLAKEGLELTDEALNQSIERQKLGTVKPFEVFQAQAFFLQARIDYFKAINEYNKAQFALKVAKGETL